MTAEAGVAKGVMHRHFADFDTFLTELVLDRATRLKGQASALDDTAGTSTVADNLTDTLIARSSSPETACAPDCGRPGPPASRSSPKERP